GTRDRGTSESARVSRSSCQPPSRCTSRWREWARRRGGQLRRYGCGRGAAALAARGERGRAAAAASFDDMVAAAARLRSTLVAYWVGKAATFVWVVDARG